MSHNSSSPPIISSINLLLQFKMFESETELLMDLVEEDLPDLGDGIRDSNDRGAIHFIFRLPLTLLDSPLHCGNVVTKLAGSKASTLMRAILPSCSK